MSAFALPFWAIAGLLILLAVGILLWPRPSRLDSRRAVNLALFRQREAELQRELNDGRLTADEFKALHTELSVALLADVEKGDGAGGRTSTLSEASAANRAGERAPILLVPLVALLAIWGYDHFGALEDLELAAAMADRGNPVAATNANAATAIGEHQGAPNAELVERLEARLNETPENAEGWFLLGRSSLDIGDYGRAARAFGKVLELVPDAQGPLVMRAQAEYLAADRNLTKPVQGAIDAVLKVLPDDPVMMEILAVEAFEAGEYRSVINFLNRGLAKGVAGEQAEFFRQGIARASELLGEPVPETAPAMAAEAGAPAIEVTVASLNTLPAGTVFVTAKMAQGPPMPLAVVRKSVADLPFRVRLDARAAMSPDMTLGTALQAQQAVVVSVRYSQAGTAERAADDVEAVSAPIRLRQGQVETVDLQLGGSTQIAADAAASDAPGNRSIRVRLQVADSLDVPPGAHVFVFAREIGGPAMPVAVQRINVAALTEAVVLDDTKAMAPGRTLSSVGDVELIARISRTGDATATAGDLEGRVGPISNNPSAQEVALLIDRIYEG